MRTASQRLTKLTSKKDTCSEIFIPQIITTLTRSYCKTVSYNSFARYL